MPRRKAVCKRQKPQPTIWPASRYRGRGPSAETAELRAAIVAALAISATPTGILRDYVERRLNRRFLPSTFQLQLRTLERKGVVARADRSQARSRSDADIWSLSPHPPARSGGHGP